MTRHELRERRKALPGQGRRGEMMQAELAELLGYHENTVRKWENGHQPIPPVLGRALRDVEREITERAEAEQAEQDAEHRHNYERATAFGRYLHDYYNQP